MMMPAKRDCDCGECRVAKRVYEDHQKWEAKIEAERSVAGRAVELVKRMAARKDSDNPLRQWTWGMPMPDEVGKDYAEAIRIAALLDPRHENEPVNERK